MIRYKNLLLILAVSLLTSACPAQALRIWLTHQTSDPSRIVVSWETAQPTASVVHYGLTAIYDQMAKGEGQTTLHHVEISKLSGCETARILA